MLLEHEKWNQLMAIHFTWKQLHQKIGWNRCLTTIRWFNVFVCGNAIYTIYAVDFIRLPYKKIEYKVLGIYRTLNWRWVARFLCNACGNESSNVQCTKKLHMNFSIKCMKSSLNFECIIKIQRKKNLQCEETQKIWNWKVILWYLNIKMSCEIKSKCHCSDWLYHFFC